MGRPRKPDPYCECNRCGKQLQRKRFNGTLEDIGHFLKRKFCDRACMAAAMTQEEVTRSGYRQRIEHLRGDKCEECGTTEKLTNNHKNRDWSDNAPGNLETLCMSCHMKKHWAEPGGLYPYKPVQPCSVCGKVEARVHSGMCSKHWQRFKRYGSPHLKKLQKNGPIVTVED